MAAAGAGGKPETYTEALERVVKQTGEALGLPPKKPLNILANVSTEKLTEGGTVAAGAPVVVIGPNGKPVEEGQGGKGRRRRRRRASKRRTTKKRHTRRRHR